MLVSASWPRSFFFAGLAFFVAGLAFITGASVDAALEDPLAEILADPPEVARKTAFAYSVPSRLVHESLRVHVYEDKLDMRYGGASQLVAPRLLGRNGRRINYRYIIWSLVQKPGAFAQYRYREELFPTLTSRRAYDALAAKHALRTSYLRLLHLAAQSAPSAPHHAGGPPRGRPAGPPPGGAGRRSPTWRSGRGRPRLLAGWSAWPRPSWRRDRPGRWRWRAQQEFGGA